MSKEHVELLQRAYALLATGVVLWDSLDENVEVHDHDTPDQGDYRGHAGFGRWLEDWEAAWAEYTFEPEEFIDRGDVVVAVIRMTAKGRTSGIEVRRQDALVYKFRDGKIASLDYYNSKEQALEAAGIAK
jgi:ketosteroid isomerase-like protein